MGNGLSNIFLFQLNSIGIYYVVKYNYINYIRISNLIIIKLLLKIYKKIYPNKQLNSKYKILNILRINLYNFLIENTKHNLTFNTKIYIIFLS